MSVRGIPAPNRYVPAHYWEDRARRFAAEGEGLAAVCAYGMPDFYNRVIHWCQRLALAPWLRVQPGLRVLDLGCGVGRWSLLLAGRGAEVTGVDLSPTMIGEAQGRAVKRGLAQRCRFEVQDLAQLDAQGSYGLVLGVTVLQHILDPQAVQSALARMARHLAEGGRMVLLEAAPVEGSKRCDTSVFRARKRDEYLRLFAAAGLEVCAITGVDPMPFKTWLLPHLRRLPGPLGLTGIALVTLLSLPFDLLLGRLAVRRSWHAVFVLQHASGDSNAT